MSITAVLVALLTGGALAYLKDLVRWLYNTHRKTRPDQLEAQRIHEGVRQADESILAVARARDQLEKDNAALRADREETARRHAAERAEWQAERAMLQAERVELRQEIDALEDRLRSLLDEVQILRQKHQIT